MKKLLWVVLLPLVASCAGKQNKQEEVHVEQDSLVVEQDTASIEHFIQFLIESEQWEEAIVRLESCLNTAKHENDPSVYYLLAYCEAQLEEWEKAKIHTIQSYSLVDEEDPFADDIRALWMSIWDKPYPEDGVTEQLK